MSIKIKKHVTKDWMYKEYIIKQRTMQQIAKELKVSGSWVRHRIDEFEIPRRSKKEIANMDNTKKVRTKKCLQRYGAEYPNQSGAVIEKRQATNRKRYGSTNFLTSEEGKKKTKEACLQRHGVESTNQLEEVKKKKKQTYLRKLGVENPSQAEEVKQKKKETCIKNNNVEFPAQSKKIRNKMQQTCFENHGAKHALQVEKIWHKYYDTKKENGTFNTSKPEDEGLKFLKTKFTKVEHQYRDEKRYPFNCDYYIPSEDMFIELNAFWTHGYEPFDYTNENHQKYLEEWQSKRKSGRCAYANAIETWTKSDPHKRKTANSNNLNYLEFWSLEELYNYFKGDI